MTGKVVSMYASERPPPRSSEPPRCPACLGAGVALHCKHCPRCPSACGITCMHCGGTFDAYPGGGWLLVAQRSERV